MISILSEQPITIALTGGVLAAVLVAIWLQTYHRALLMGLGLVIAATVGCLVLERLWKTDREQVIETLYAIAHTVEQKDLQALLPFIHPSATAIRERASNEYNYYQLDEARVTQVWSVELDGKHPSQEAVVKFNVIVTGGTRSGEISNQRVARYMIVTFRRDGDTWKVVNYSHYAPQEAMRREPGHAVGG